jgi:hypothetical protein
MDKSAACDLADAKGGRVFAWDINNNGAKKYGVGSVKYILNKSRNDRNCYEMVRGKWKEFYDIDFKDPGDDWNIIESNVIDKLEKILHGRLCIKTCSNKHKISLHIVCFGTGVYLPSDMKIKAVSLNRQLNQSIVDTGVYTKDRLIRMLYSDKVGDKRFMMWHERSKHKCDADSLASLGDSFREFKILTMPSDISKEHSDILKKLNLGDFDADSLGDNCYRLMRLQSSLCPVCQRFHDNDNMWISIDKIVVLHCYRESSFNMKANLNGKWFCRIGKCNSVCRSGYYCHKHSQ